MNTELMKAVERADAARDFPNNTCAASRWVQEMGESLVKGEPYPQLAEEPARCGEAMLSVVASLYEARAALRDLEAENARLRSQAYTHRDGRIRALERLATANALLRECDEMARRRGDKYGLCDAIDNDWHPYQSAALAAYLQGAGE